MPEFTPWPKTPRLEKDMVVTEKIDGTNSAIIIEERAWQPDPQWEPDLIAMVHGPGKMDNDGHPAFTHFVYAQSRKRFITPSSDNFGFAGWVQANANTLVRLLGEGAHFGEWWGSGIQRGYGLPKGEKRFSLFNTTRWGDLNDNELAQSINLGAVPELYVGPFGTVEVDFILEELSRNGSVASSGFMKPEGVIVWHEAARVAFKAFVDDREKELERVERALEERYVQLLKSEN